MTTSSKYRFEVTTVEERAKLLLHSYGDAAIHAPLRHTGRVLANRNLIVAHFRRDIFRKVLRSIMRPLIAAMLAFFVASPAFAAMVCNNRMTVIKNLAKNYQEKSIALGIAKNGGVVELFTAKDGKTWTIVITMPNGPTCFLVAGKDWEALPNVLYGDPT